MINHPVRWRVLSLFRNNWRPLDLTGIGVEILIFHSQNINFWSRPQISDRDLLFFYSQRAEEICLFKVFVLFLWEISHTNIHTALACFSLAFLIFSFCCLSILSSCATDSLPPSSLLSSCTTSTVSCRPSQAMLTLLSGWLIARRIVVNSLAND